MCAHAYTHAHLLAHTHTHARTCAHTHTHTCTHAHLRMHICTHATRTSGGCRAAAARQWKSSRAAACRAWAARMVACRHGLQVLVCGSAAVAAARSAACAGANSSLLAHQALAERQGACYCPTTAQWRHSSTSRPDHTSSRRAPQEEVRHRQQGGRALCCRRSPLSCLTQPTAPQWPLLRNSTSTSSSRARAGEAHVVARISSTRRHPWAAAAWLQPWRWRRSRSPLWAPARVAPAAASTFMRPLLPAQTRHTTTACGRARTLPRSCPSTSSYSSHSSRSSTMAPRTRCSCLAPHTSSNTTWAPRQAACFYRARGG